MNVEIPSMKACPSHFNEVYSRDCLHGGPVTVATIRFPPTSSSIISSEDEEIILSTAEEIQNVTNNKRGNYIKFHGRIVISRGAWIESHPLFPNHSTDVDERRDGRTTYETKSKHSNVKSNLRNGGVYKILAFGGGIDGGTSSNEAVNGMIFPSSSSSCTNELPMTHHASFISIVAYGGRKLSFLTGGGLWGDVVEVENIDPTARNERKIEFSHIPIVKTNVQGSSKTRHYLEVSDWIHDARLLSIESENVSLQGQSVTFLVALGMANNYCEVWGFCAVRLPFGSRTSIDGHFVLFPTLLQCIECDLRCITYSMSFFGWEDNAKICYLDNNSGEGDGERKMEELPTLVAASGTVFGEIVVWGACNNLRRDENSLTAIVKRWIATNSIINDSSSGASITAITIRAASSHRLNGHLGSIFSVKFGFDGKYIASTSDDRTVRLWTLKHDQQQLLSHCSNIKQSIDDWPAQRILLSTSSYTLEWTGWGHTARTWDVSFTALPSKNQPDRNKPYLVSAGEDGTARIWNPYSSKDEIGNPLRGHRCESLWSVDVCAGIVITGGNDGCAKLWDFESRIQGEKDGVKTFTVPKDDSTGVTSIDDSDEGKDVSIPTSYMEEKPNTVTEHPKKKSKKKTSHEQVICGMQFVNFGSRNGKWELLIATRAGDLLSVDLVTEKWTTHGNWKKAVSLTNNGIATTVDQLTGTCIGVHPCGHLVVVGTTEGWLVAAPLVNPVPRRHQKSSDGQNNLSFCSTHRSIQSISWINHHNLLVFHARGVVTWWVFRDNNQSCNVPLSLKFVLSLETTGIPLSFDFGDEDLLHLYIGDSRGNLAYFDLRQHISTAKGHGTRVPTCLLTRVHDKEHVTGVAAMSSSGIIVSIGNDGCVHRCKRDGNGKLEKLVSVPVPNVTGLRHIWKVNHPNGEESIILGGFYGNDFVVIDSVLGYEFFRINTGGRQRRHEFLLSLVNSKRCFQFPKVYAMAICSGKKDGLNLIDFHCSHLLDVSIESLVQVKQNSICTLYSIGSSFHSELINDACWVNCCELNSTYLLSGSNDCSVKLSKFCGNSFVSTKELPPHESCVRGVCSSRHPKSHISLIVTCGGKLSMEFYLLDHSLPADSCISFLCSYRTLEKTTIDHRMNTVRSCYIETNSIQSWHLVAAGDSDGNIHIVVLPEEPVARKTVVGKVIAGDGRPILCLALLPVLGRILLFVGTTAGDITIYSIPSLINVGTGVVGAHCLENSLQTTPICSLRSHQTGVNDMSVSTTQCSNLIDECRVLICSVGDDQAVSICVVDVNCNQNQPLYCEDYHVTAIQSASASPLKAVSLVADDTTFFRIYAAGHEQMNIYHLDSASIKTGNLKYAFLASSPLGTEGNCIDCVHLRKFDGSVHEVIAIGGDGVEVESFNVNILRAAMYLHAANFLLITAGAGLSADSGLNTYEDAPIIYKELCDPSKLIDCPLEFQQFWLNFTKKYLDALPHYGYTLLDQWCGGCVLPNLRRCLGDIEGIDMPWRVYTSNVDGHFRQFGSFQTSLCEIHGNALEFICACGIGFSDGKTRLGDQWEKWNNGVASRATTECIESTVKIDETTLEGILGTENLFLCCHCRCTMRPNVLMFHDTDENVLRPINKKREHYQMWESQVESEAAKKQSKLVVLELGCGINVPAVRQESEEVAFDTSKKMESNCTAIEGSCCLIRINPKDAHIEVPEHGLYQSISIFSKAENALRLIDCWLRAGVFSSG